MMWFILQYGTCICVIVYFTEQNILEEKQGVETRIEVEVGTRSQYDDCTLIN